MWALSRWLGLPRPLAPQAFEAVLQVRQKHLSLTPAVWERRHPPHRLQRHGLRLAVIPHAVFVVLGQRDQRDQVAALRGLSP